MNAAGTNPVRLTNGHARARGPRGHATVRRSLSHDRDNLLNFEIYSMNANGSSPHRLTNNSVPDFAPNW